MALQLKSTVLRLWRANSSIGLEACFVIEFAPKSTEVFSFFETLIRPLQIYGRNQSKSAKRDPKCAGRFAS